jgi:hypothetical protein
MVHLTTCTLSLHSQADRSAIDNPELFVPIRSTIAMTTAHCHYAASFQIDEEENRATRSTARPSASDGPKSFPDKPLHFPGPNPAAGVRNPRHDSSLPVGSLLRLRPARVAAAVVLCTSTRAPGGAACRAARQLDAAMTRLRGRDSRPSRRSHRGPECASGTETRQTPVLPGINRLVSVVVPRAYCSARHRPVTAHWHIGPACWTLETVRFKFGITPSVLLPWPGRLDTEDSEKYEKRSPPRPCFDRPCQCPPDCPLSLSLPG